MIDLFEVVNGFLKSVSLEDAKAAATIAGGSASVGTFAVKTWPKLKMMLETPSQSLDYKSLRYLSSHNCSLAVFPGEGNQWKLAEGIIGPSEYVSSATKTFLESASNLDGVSIVDGTDEDFIHKLKEDKDALVLGGPVANIITRRYLGYREIPILDLDKEGRPRKNEDGSFKRKILPVFDPDSGMPFGFFCGIGDYGWYPKGAQIMPSWERANNTDGMEYKSISRFREDGEFVGPHTGIVWRDGRIEKLQHYNGQLAEEVLLVARLPHPRPQFPHRTMTILGGAHGYTVREFGYHWKINLNKLKKHTDNEEFFMALIWARFRKDKPWHVSLEWAPTDMKRKIVVEPIKVDKYREWIKYHSI